MGTTRSRDGIEGWCAAFPAILAAVALQLAAIAPAEAALIPVRFLLDGRIEGPAAPFLLALDRGYYRDEGLDVTIEPGESARETVTKVVGGGYDIGLGDVNRLIRLKDDVPQTTAKAVMMIHDRPAYAIIGRASRGISKDLTSLQSKVLGAPRTSAAYSLWPVFKAINDIEDGSIRIEEVGAPVREPMLAAGEVDAVFGSLMGPAVSLKARGVETSDIVVIAMADYGLEVYGSALVVSGRFLAGEPEAVRGFIRAVLRGFRDAMADPAAALASVLKRSDNPQPGIEGERLKVLFGKVVLTPWVEANGFGGIDEARFRRGLDQLARGARFKTKLEPKDVFTDSYLPPIEERRLK